MNTTVEIDKSENSTTPLLAQWDITSGCNFRCKFCLTASENPLPNEFTTKEAYQLIDKLYEGGILFLRVLGGEPLFRKDWYEILGYASRKGMILSFSTNASLVTNKNADKIASLKNSIRYLQVSLYGCDQSTYEQTTGQANGHSQAIAGLEKLIARDIEVSILIVATPQNASHIHEYFNIVKTLPVQEVRIAPQISLGRAIGNDSLPENQLEPISEASILSDLVLNLRQLKETLKPEHPTVRLQARPLLGNYLKQRTGLDYFYQNCDAALRMVYIDPVGNISPCPFLANSPIQLQSTYEYIKPGNIKISGFAEIWDSKDFGEFRRLFEPSSAKFEIFTKCKYYRDGSCIPCAITPCSCVPTLSNLKKANLKKKSIPI